MDKLPRDMTRNRTIRFYTPQYSGRLVVRNGRVTEAPMRLGRLLGWTSAQLDAYMERSGWGWLNFPTGEKP